MFFSWCSFSVWGTEGLNEDYLLPSYHADCSIWFQEGQKTKAPQGPNQWPEHKHNSQAVPRLLWAAAGDVCSDGSAAVAWAVCPWAFELGKASSKTLQCGFLGEMGLDEMLKPLHSQTSVLHTLCPKGWWCLVGFQSYRPLKPIDFSVRIKSVLKITLERLSCSKIMEKIHCWSK